MRILFDCIVIIACIFAPWLLVATLIVMGLLTYRKWYEGAAVAVLLDMVIFGAMIGLHTIYILLGFCALYYLTIRFKEMLRIA